jgi:hypothetical protein
MFNRLNLELLGLSIDEIQNAPITFPQSPPVFMPLQTLDVWMARKRIEGNCLKSRHNAGGMFCLHLPELSRG